MRSKLMFAVLLAAFVASAQKHANLNINTRGDADSCATLQVSSDNGELARSDEKFNLQRSDAAVLELNAAERGIVRVRGWKQSGYSVEACKIAVAADRATAATLLSGISVNRSAGRFSFSGPSADTGNWQVYFILHVPDNSSLDLESRNGPISIADVSGNIKARAINGPLSIRSSSGNIDAQTTNGPISFEGESGDVHLHAQNGPISVKLSKAAWNGPALEATTFNGPLSLSLPEGFQSGIRVETGGHAPLSCKHEVCAHASTAPNGDQNVLHLNGSSDIVRITTHNGPLSVNAPKTKRAL